MSVDPLASEFVAWSPYNYVFNNPLSFTDPDGRAPSLAEVDPPHNFFRKGGDGPLFDYANQDTRNEKGVIRIYAHGNNNGFNAIDKNGETVRIRSTDDFDDFTLENSEDWLSYRLDRTETTVILLSCNCAGEFSSDDTTPIKVKTSFAEELSKEFPDNLTVKGFDGKMIASGEYQDLNKNSKQDKNEPVVKGAGVFKGIRKAHGDKVGKLRIFKSGKQVGNKPMNYDGGSYNESKKDEKKL